MLRKSPQLYFLSRLYVHMSGILHTADLANYCKKKVSLLRADAYNRKHINKYFGSEMGVVFRIKEIIQS